ncbi:MAG: UDP-N-acetylglucosamine 1-carboxyvinyltransferase [Ruminococcaceae bacterium]|nr:UDP-N-acetylglucosamine 1-carboxyvinyltransferase [Oscillospiraceae bacterium]
MASLVINGGRRLNGSLVAQGSKNSALPILAATYLVNGKSIIHNCPRLSDVECTIKILENLGCKTERRGTDLIVDSTSASGHEIPESLMREMRSSVVFLGAILGRAKKAKISTPGGCEIGLRPIDLHLFAMRKLGVEIEESYGKLLCTIPQNLKGTKITLTFPSVGATENAVLLASVARGTTTIINAAREPEIIDLCNFLNKCGAKISGAGESVIVIEGVEKLEATEHSVICDRIAAATYLFAGAITGGDIALKNTVPQHLNSILPVLEETGCEISIKCNEIRLKAPLKLRRIDKLITQPYPGFPTDAQAPIMTLTAIAEGTSVIVENIFESRFKHVPELLRMGAKIRTEGRVAVIDGVKRLYGASVVSPDLRGGSALVLAGLVAHGTTEVGSLKHIDRGYENFENNLCMLNADIIRME